MERDQVIVQSMKIQQNPNFSIFEQFLQFCCITKNPACETQPTHAAATTSGNYIFLACKLSNPDVRINVSWADASSMASFALLKLVNGIT